MCSATLILGIMKYLTYGFDHTECFITDNEFDPVKTAPPLIRHQRKNWLFADTPKGADASVRVYSIVEAAKANGLDVFKYLEELLQNMPTWDHTEKYLERMMPWSD